MRGHLFPRVLIGLAMLVGLGVVSIGLSFVNARQVNAAEAKAAPVNLIDLHMRAGQLTNKQCLACHGKILTSTSLNKKIKTFHRLHLESKLPTPKNCADCHQAVDLRNGSAAALRKQVNPQICAGCHTGAMKGAKILFAH